MRPSRNAAANVTSTDPDERITAAGSEPDDDADATVFQPAFGVTLTTSTPVEVTWSSTTPASPIAYDVINGGEFVDPKPSLVTDSTAIGVEPAEDADRSTACGADVELTVRMLGASADSARLLRTWVLASAAAVPAASTPTSERAVAVRVFMSVLSTCRTVRSARQEDGETISKIRQNLGSARSSSLEMGSPSRFIRHNEERRSDVRVLVVEDDDAIASGLVDGLTNHGFTPTRVRTGREALAAAEPEVVLLDLGLPDMDGRDVCRQLRARSAVPIIMLTARSDEIDRVLGLELGADDYVTKPFSFRELVARIRAVTRRTNTSSDVSDESRAIVRGVLVIDRRAHRVTLSGEEVRLTPKEFDLLAFLAEEPDVVRTRGQILDNVWDVNWYGPTKTVDAHVATLRQKLGDARWIEAVRGVGFRLNEVDAS